MGDEPGRVALGKLALERVDQPGEAALVNPERALDRVREDPGEGTRDRRGTDERAGRTRDQRRRGGGGKKAVPEAACRGTEGKGRDCGGLGKRRSHHRPQREHAGRRLLEERRPRAKGDEGGRDLGRRRARPGIGGQRRVHPGAETGIGRLCRDGHGRVGQRAGDGGVGKDRLGQPVAGRAAVTLVERKLEKLGHDAPLHLARHRRLPKDAAVREPPAHHRRPRDPRGQGPRLDGDVGKGQRHVDRRAQDVPAERHPVQPRRPRKRKMPVHEPRHPRAAGREVIPRGGTHRLSRHCSRQIPVHRRPLSPKVGSMATEENPRTSPDLAAGALVTVPEPCAIGPPWLPGPDPRGRFSARRTFAAKPRGFPFRSRFAT